MRSVSRRSARRREDVRLTRGATPFLNLDFVSYPISHSLIAVIGWALLASAVFWLTKRNRTVAYWIGLCVLSHWVLDFVTHRPDLPILPGNQTRVGLGLWYSVAGTVVLEGAMFLAGLWLYLRSTEPLDRIGRRGLVGFVAFLLVGYVASIAGPPPPDARAVPWAALASWILPVWAGWFDRHRRFLAATLPTA